ncbi:MAG: prephenate dehydratase [Bacteroidales bacterium]|nr:prephenate dehydratase [Bacteroidales bacterium]MDY2591893.1 prephenate dehydratase [Sodaliphilus sp.]MDD7017442.1 prephenate dehydratase [Bacteroidales bacterium]MDD7164079.1 prephenate dehydratase [Bacteroidales bacterium]MDY3736089.1 prephenate dehydratase [Sodaliphilus sp.]
MDLRVAIQGVAGCFHDAAAREYFEGQDIETVPCETFNGMFNLLKSDASMLGILAIENTIAGSLLQNHELLRQSNMTIVGEYKKYISHSIAALPGQSIDDIAEVNSHPMALRQCEQYLQLHPKMKMVETYDTAGSAKMIAENNLVGHAAICGRYAAELYGLNVLEDDIQTNKRNFTRFLVVTDPCNATGFKNQKAVDKASIAFTLPHSQGSLSAVLVIFSFYGMNLTKIQSLPIIGREWEYRFYVNLTFNDYTRYRQSIDAVRPLISDFKILGEYAEYK